MIRLYLGSCFVLAAALAGCAFADASHIAPSNGPVAVHASIDRAATTRKWWLHRTERALRLARGSDGRIWFSDPPYTGAISTDGHITRYPVTSYNIAAGPKGFLWISSAYTASLISVNGAATTFNLPKGSCSGDIAYGPDQNAWMVDFCANSIDRITPQGAVSVFVIPTKYTNPNGITAGGDGNMWFTENLGQKVGRVTPSGVITEFTGPNGEGGLGFPALGCDNNIYVPVGPTHLWKVTPQGVITDLNNPSQPAYGDHLVLSADRKSLWIGLPNAGALMKFDIATRTFSAPIRVLYGTLEDVAIGADGGVWFSGLSGRDSVPVIGDYR